MNQKTKYPSDLKTNNIENVDTEPKCRSIQSINENNQKDLERINGEGDTICDYYSRTPPNNVKSGGYVDQNIPLWITSDTSTLPEYQRSHDIRKSFNNIKDILDSDEIDDSLKVRLYSFFKQKYDNTRSMPKTTYVSENEVLDYETKNNILSNAVAKIPTVYRKHLAKSIGNVLLNNSRYVTWDPEGFIIIPPNTKVDFMKLEKLLDILISKKKGTQHQIGVITDIIKPFYNKISKYIKNDKIIDNSIDTSKVGDIKYII